ncbi:tRNA lysidine(34) synthetase TilS [Sulfurovum sp.]|uniref:tRNA lysidine(34) synthetase TilS n=1 Tax=Sulfurovum sp. TaxID=1969726 RepID=UPI002867E2A8|nr:tRNA lysidine(34) synthetase TilS [Sulfurovum sp.]
MLNLDITNLENKKNLLAFSAGIDSSALFFLLIENNIKFDIAIVDYGLREQSKEEVLHAKALAKQHKLFCHNIKAPKLDTHFEKQARDFRYEFFESLISIEGYDTLLTAHQLGDQLEWLLMRLTKGAGVSELLGLEPVSQRKNYTLIRPLLTYSKEELITYLEDHDYPYFVDGSNSDEKYERNKFRKQFSDPLLLAYKDGIKRSFDYLRQEKIRLEQEFETIHSQKELRIIKLHTPSAKVKATDLALKELGYLLSSSQREEIEKENSLVIGGLWAVETQNDMLYIAPYLTTDMPKVFKEKCRMQKIPAKLRAYYFKENIIF